MNAKAKRLTVKAVRAKLQAKGLTLKSCDGQYRVAFKGRNSEASAYYAEDLEDALKTGYCLALNGYVSALDAWN